MNRPQSLWASVQVCPVRPPIGPGRRFVLTSTWNPLQIADDRPAGLDEPLERIAEVVHDLVGQDPPRGDVVAVAEAAGDGQDLVTVRCRSGFSQDSVDVHALGRAPGQFEGVGGFPVAVGAGGAEDEGLGLHRRVILSTTAIGFDVASKLDPFSHPHRSTAIGQFWAVRFARRRLAVLYFLIRSVNHSGHQPLSDASSNRSKRASFMHAGHDHGEGLESSSRRRRRHRALHRYASAKSGKPTRDSSAAARTTRPSLSQARTTRNSSRRRRAGEFRYSNPAADGNYTLNLLFADWVTTRRHA